MLNGLCAGLGEHHRLCRREYVNVQHGGDNMVEIPPKGGLLLQLQL